MGLDAGLDVEAFAGFAGRLRRRRKESGMLEMRRLLDQANERRRIAGEPGHLHLAALDPQLGDEGVIREHFRQRLEDDHARWRRLLAALQHAQRAAAVLAEAHRRATRRDLARESLLLAVQAV